MSWILCRGPPLEPQDLKQSDFELRKSPSQIMNEDSTTSPEPFEFDADDDGVGGDDCELEWESWATDLTRQAVANSSNNIAVTVTEPVSIHPNYLHHRIRPTASSSTFSSLTLSEQATPASPTSYRPGDIPPGANMGLLSVDSPALLTAPSVLPFQGTGVTTSTVSAGGVVRTRSLISIDGRRGRGVARAMEILAEDGAGGGAHSSRKHRASRRNRAREENVRGAVASSAPARSIAVPSASLNTITSTVTVHESGTPLLMQMHSSPFWEGSPGATSTSASASALGVGHCGG